MRLILGLGNPGAEYEGTRHNVGFAVVEELARRRRIALSGRSHRARVGRGRIGREPVILAEPLTYMNLVGESARPLLAANELGAEALVVIHDEADFPPGGARLKMGGGTAGHRGLASLVEHLGTPEFLRVRVGIGRPADPREALEDYVLDRPGPADAELLVQGVGRGADAVEILLLQGLEAAMRAVHRPD